LPTYVHVEGVPVRLEEHVMKLRRLTKHEGSTVDQYDRARRGRRRGRADVKADGDEDEDSSDERQTGRKGDKHAGAAIVSS